MIPEDKFILRRIRSITAQEVRSIEEAVHILRSNIENMYVQGNNPEDNPDMWMTEFETLANSLESCVTNIRTLVQEFNLKLKEIKHD